ncbi:DUF2690 domain-containing protein [Paenarthrobacter sp. NPDC092416]|uniref:DUF2690 domain-containing protein n=1 Tax=Paenarthrobacter sp. NPDC092416 TaxID=3364386 RepID=UPI00381F3137
MRKRTTLAAVIAVAASAVLMAPAANASASHHGLDPVSSGCASGAYVVSTWNMVNQKYNQVQGKIQLMYSPACQTNWVNLYGNVSGNYYNAGIFVGTVPGGSMRAGVTNVGTDYSNMVYAPGSTCVTVGSSITDIASGVVEMNNSRTFC